MSIKKILVSQPQPAIIEKSPFFEIVRKHKVDINYNPFNRVQGVSLKEFRGQRVEILTHTAVIFTSRTTVDSFFRICEEARITVPETMKYICQTEAVALYLQKYIVYRKRKIFFADGSFTNFLELIIKHKEEKYMLALSEPHKPELPEALERLKLNVDKVILAKTVQTDVSKLPLAEYDLVALYSPSDVAAFKSAYEDKPMPRVATFGDATARAAVAAGITINVMAPTPAAPSMTKAIDIYLDKLAAGEEVAPVELDDDQSNEEFIRTQQAKLAKKTRARKSTTTVAAAPAKKSTTTAKKTTATKSTTVKKTTTVKD
ncbi:MAG: uroporphyrinogen-III synthase [Rikenellaceae bacterium]|jgi:uroporphyrinogen-III synthase|nr:uroporphyrinogen-III synthase [Rikenellaceae bacterium]